jgi:hypothetical protein
LRPIDRDDRHTRVVTGRYDDAHARPLRATRFADSAGVRNETAGAAPGSR